MPTIAIIYSSGYGHTAKQAEAVQQGFAEVKGAQVNVYRIDKDGNLPEASMDAIAKADAVIYGSPTYMGGPAWLFKKFGDTSSKPWFSLAWNDKIAGGFTNSAALNGDKFPQSNIWTFSQQHGQIWVGTGLMPSNTKAHGPNDVNWTGGYAGALAISPADASPEEPPRSSDLMTARLLGKRIAEIAARVTKG